MQFEITSKGALYCADCARCGATVFTHEWADFDHNERRDMMQDGSLACDECGRAVDPETFTDCGRQYAARFHMPGFLDCTEWHYGKNKRDLKSEVCEMYGDCE